MKHIFKSSMITFSKDFPLPFVDSGLISVTLSSRHVFVYKRRGGLAYATRHQILLSTKIILLTCFWLTQILESCKRSMMFLSSLCSCPHHWWELCWHSLYVPLQIQWKLASWVPPRSRFPWTILVCHLIGFWPRQKDGALSNTWHVVLLCYHDFNYFLAILPNKTLTMEIFSSPFSDIDITVSGCMFYRIHSLYQWPKM